MRTDLWLGVGGIFVAVTILVGVGLDRWLAARTPARRRLQAMRDADEGRALAGEPWSQVEAAMERWNPRLPGVTSTRWSRWRDRLRRAGIVSPRGRVVWFATALLLPVGVAVGSVLLLGTARWRTALVMAVVATAVMHLAISRQTAARRRAIRHALPDAIDLLTLCVEAGTGLDQAVIKTSEELALTSPVLSEELRAVTEEIRLGRARTDAFRRFAERSGVEDVAALAHMLSQTDRFGTGIGPALRAHAASARTVRRQEAEERAARVGVLMVLPLVACLFPAIYVVVFGPAVIQIARQMMGR